MRGGADHADRGRLGVPAAGQVEFSSSVRRTDDGWRVEAFETGTRAAPAVLRTMGSLLRDLGDALEGAAGDSSGR